MKRFLQSLKRQDGFTLVELMVVVAIIGILSAVAVPNFKKYQAKSKVSEAKLQLSALYTAMTSFYSDYNTYAGCLAFMGYNPAAESANRYYAVGFNTATNVPDTAWTGATNSGLITGAGDAGCTQDIAAGTDGENYFAPGKGSGAAIADNTHLQATDYDTTSGLTFTAGAAGVIAGNKTAASGGDGSSALSMNQDKVMSTLRLGY